jgi:hypothetical protein
MECTVIRAYTKCYPDPINVNTGDELIPGKEDDQFPGWVWAAAVKDGKAGWMPKNIIKQHNSKYISSSDYNAMELTVNEGDKLKILRSESGWLLCQTSGGETGWIPASIVKQ